MLNRIRHGSLPTLKQYGGFYAINVRRHSKKRTPRTYQASRMKQAANTTTQIVRSLEGLFAPWRPLDTDLKNIDAPES
jgi:hypothetical protein